MDSYEQNAAELNTYLLAQRTSLRKFDAPQEVPDSYRDMLDHMETAEFLRKASLMPPDLEPDGQEKEKEEEQEAKEEKINRRGWKSGRK